MTKKLYSQSEETANVVNEPSVAYQQSINTVSVYQLTDAEHRSISRAKEQYVRGEYISESDMDKLVAEWGNLKLSGLSKPKISFFR